MLEQLSEINPLSYKKQAIMIAVYEAMSHMKANIIQTENLIIQNSGQIGYFLTSVQQNADILSMIVKFSFLKNDAVQYFISLPENYNNPKFKLRLEERHIITTTFLAKFNGKTQNQNDLAFFDSCYKFVFKSFFYFQGSLSHRSLVKLLQRQIQNSIKKIEFIFRNIETNFVKMQKNKKIDDKCRKNLLQLREAFQKNRMMRHKSSSITLKLKQIKIVSEVMNMLLHNKIKLNQLRQIKASIKSGVELYEKIQQKLKKKESETNIMQKGILTGITIKQVMKKRVLYEGKISKICQGLYIFKKQTTLFDYQQNHQGEVKIDNKIPNTIKQMDESKTENEIMRELIQKKSTDQYVQVFKNQKSFLRFVRNIKFPYIAQYYSQVQKKNIPNNIIYAQKYDKDLQNLISQGLNLKEKIKITYKLSIFLNFLRRQKVCHRDLKPGNIMVDLKLNPRVIDWGSCCGFYSLKKNEGYFKESIDLLMSTKGYYQSYGDIQYMKLRHPYEKQQVNKGEFFDIYSFGQILADIFQLDIVNQDLNTQDRHIIENIKYLQLKCQQLNPEDRLTALQINIYLHQLKKIVLLSYSQDQGEQIDKNYESKDQTLLESSQIPSFYEEQKQDSLAISQ